MTDHHREETGTSLSDAFLEAAVDSDKVNLQAACPQAEQTQPYQLLLLSFALETCHHLGYLSLDTLLIDDLLIQRCPKPHKLSKVRWH